MTKAITRGATYLLLGAMAVTMLVPFLWMVSTSLMTELEVYQFPPRFIPEEIQWNNYPDALTILPFGRFFLNSLIITAGAWWDSSFSVPWPPTPFPACASGAGTKSSPSTL